MSYTIDDQFIGKAPAVRAIYDRIMAQVRSFGVVHEEPKKTCIHLANQSAFAGIHTRKSFMLLTIRADHAILSPRIVKSDQPSRSRYHHDVRLESPEDVDEELLGWLKAAYELSA